MHYVQDLSMYELWTSSLILHKRLLELLDVAHLESFWYPNISTVRIIEVGTPGVWIIEAQLYTNCSDANLRNWP